MNVFCTFPTINISQLIFWLVICIAKDLIGNFLNIFAPSDFDQILSYPNKLDINVKHIYQLSDDV